MRYKIFFFVLALFLVFYFYIAHLNPENVKILLRRAASH